MKRFLISILLLFTSCGDIGSSSSSTDVNQNQVFNPDPTKCRVECSFNPETGELTAFKECEGSGIFPVADVSLDLCDTITEIEVEEEPSEEEA